MIMMIHVVPFMVDRDGVCRRCSMTRLRDAAQSDNLSDVHFRDRRSVKRRCV
jgi:hypothetical protein